MLVEFNIFCTELSKIDYDNNKVINTINPHSYCVAKSDVNFKEALIQSDILLPDGIGIVWAIRLLKGTKIKKIAGFDLFLFLMNKLNEEKGSVFFLGSTKENLEEIKSKSKIDFPNVRVDFFSPPYKNVFSKEDSELMCSKVNNAKPDVLFVGMTAPKQEKWVQENKDRLFVRNIASIGAVFDFYSGNIERAPSFMINIGIEWLHRSLKSRRLFLRNFVSNPKFLVDILIQKFKR